MKIAVTGWGSMLGKELINRGAIALQADITSKSAISRAINSISPDIIIHNEEFSINFCEEKQEQAYQVICNGTNNLLDVIDGKVKKIIYISSDQVFSGNNFFSYKEHHDPNPVNWYGFCKMVAEKLIGFLAVSEGVVVRTSTLFSEDSISGTKKALLLALKPNYEKLQIPKSKSIKRSYMYVSDFADALMKFIEMDKLPSLIHIAGTMIISEYEFYRYYALSNLLPIDPIVELTDKDLETSGETPVPKRGGLNVDKAKKLGLPLKSYAEGIERMLQHEKE